MLSTIMKAGTIMQRVRGPLVHVVADSFADSHLFVQLSPEIIFTGHADRNLPDARGSSADISTLPSVNVWGHTGVRHAASSCVCTARAVSAFTSG